jgi:lipopolysaccharide export system permease protein
MKKKIFQKILSDVTIFFLVVLIAIGSIVWVMQAVNFLDYIVEDGHGFKVYFNYTFLNFPKILSGIFPFVLFLSLFYTITKYENNNELLIFWTNGITKEDFAKTILKFSLIYLIIQIILTTIIVPKSQNLARSYIRASTIDFFPSLLKEKKFIDTVENLTIFIGKKNANGEMFNIILKDKLDDGSSQIIYAKKGYLDLLENENFLILENGKIINIESKKIVSLDFGQTKFNLSNYTTKTTTWPKIQEHHTFALFSCVVNTLAKEIILKENFYLKCTPNFYKEVVQELLKRIYLPIYLPIISLIACFLIIKSKESFSYAKLKILLFILGVLTIIISELSVKLASINQLAFIVFLFIPILIFFLTFNIFKMKSKII